MSKQKTAAKRGRPKSLNESLNQRGILQQKLKLALQRTPQRAVFLSTTKGGMKILYEGHHFKYLYRRNECSIFQCCYNENNDQCQVRIVTNRNLVYPFDGEHIHYSQATDKSVTSLMFEADPYDAQITSVETLPYARIDQSKEAATDQFAEKVLTLSELIVDSDNSMIDLDTNTRGENKPTIIADVCEESEANDANVGVTSAAADDFREKIKRRLQKALMAKKK